MSIHTVQRVAWWVLVVGTAASLALGLTLDHAFSDKAEFVNIPFLGYAVVGSVIAWRRPANGIGWVFLLIGLLTSLGILSTAGMLASLDSGEPVAWWGVLAAWYQNWFWVTLFMLSTTFTFLLFPDGLASPRWRPVFWTAVVVTAAAALSGVLDPTLSLSNATPNTVANPISPAFFAGTKILDEESGWSVLLFLIGSLCGVAAIVSVVWRTWRSRGIERLQMRMFASAILLVPLSFLLSAIFPGFDDSWLGNLTFTAALTAIPVSCGVAIMRYRLYDIDRVIGRTTAYAIVTGLLLAVYFVVVTLVTQLLPDQSNSFAVAAATLAAAALFRPVLSRVQAFVDRRFNRSRYDAQRTVEAFAGRLRDEVAPDAVTADLLAVLQTTVQPSGAALWLKAGAP